MFLVLNSYISDLSYTFSFSIVHIWDMAGLPKCSEATSSTAHAWFHTKCCDFVNFFICLLGFNLHSSSQRGFSFFEAKKRNKKPFGKLLAHSLHTAFTQWPTAHQQHGRHRTSSRHFPPAQPELFGLGTILRCVEGNGDYQKSKVKITKAPVFSQDGSLCATSCPWPPA